jgi:hypothetical protein
MRSRLPLPLPAGNVGTFYWYLHVINGDIYERLAGLAGRPFVIAGHHRRGSREMLRICRRSFGVQFGLDQPAMLGLFLCCPNLHGNPLRGLPIKFSYLTASIFSKSSIRP